MAIKASLTYEVGEAAAALGKSTATIRNWVRGGLPIMSERKPYLILGLDLRNFLRAKEKAAKCPLKLDELYCLSCRAGRKPLGMAAVCVLNNAKTSRLCGICDHCGASASRLISNTKADAFAQIFHFKIDADSDA
jgi:hypothetical protein